MKHFIPILLVAGFTIGLAWSALAQEDPATATAHAVEYRVVPLSDIHSSTLDYLKGAFGESEGGIMGLAKAADDQLAKKTEDLLNELGAEGWELLHYSKTSLILMRRSN